MRGVGALSLVELRLFVREPAAVGFTLALPLLLLVLNGGRPGNDLDAAQVGLVALVMATGGIMGLAETLASDRERGVLRRLRLTPLRPVAVLVAHAAAQLAVAAAGAALVLGVAAAAFGAEPPQEPLRALAAGASCALCCAALGAAIGALAPTSRTATAVASAVYFPTIFLSGVVMAPEALPGAARAVGEALPLTHAVRGLSDAWTGAPLAPETLLVPAAVVVLGAAACARAFRWS